MAHGKTRSTFAILVLREHQPSQPLLLSWELIVYSNIGIFKATK